MPASYAALMTSKESFSSRIHGEPSHFEEPYDMHPRIILETLRPLFPRLLDMLIEISQRHQYRGDAPSVFHLVFCIGFCSFAIMKMKSSGTPSRPGVSQLLFTTPHSDLRFPRPSLGGTVTDDAFTPFATASTSLRTSRDRYTGSNSATQS